jgi:hypothetical protein
VDLDDGGAEGDERREEVGWRSGGGQVKFKIRITTDAASGRRGCG